MKITFTGTGTSQGVPIIACHCAVCTSPDPHNKRLRSSVWVEADGLSLVIDTGPDFRYQMLRSKVDQLDAVLFTHSHKDHIAGLDDVRAYNYFQKKPMDVYATIETQAALRREYAYIFENGHYPGVPQIDLHTIHDNRPFSIGNLEVIPLLVKHYEMNVLGFRIGDFSYITDANYIAPEQMEKMKGSRVLVLNALRKEAHVSHFTLSEAIDIAQQIGAEQTYFTHISHQLGLHDEVNKQLPKGIQLAFDCLSIEC
ncbi:MAG: MBL fold metallo-hydrolase [Bacteroidetes bacterium]|nr:MBL fold metallo-hydrolase [Bacteroidota bacterium]MBS1739720.1 MBL fold metallo-hydrolase [Bacteroidota bacterium]MBS1776677.1 MBL fold metallo-hydrolase [Bacteroidota bacterium]